MNNKYREKILCIDDEQSVLNSIKRALRGFCEIEFADNAERGLEYLKNSGSYAVIVSDMKMPGMDGVTLLAKSKEMAPDSSRIMLTGDSDQSTAINALNEGDVFRFLKKPFDNKHLQNAIASGIRQYRSVIAEKDLLQRTVHGSVQALVDILSMANPGAFRMSGRLKEITSQIGQIQSFEPPWLLELAAMLAPIGYVTLPDEIWHNRNQRETLKNEERERLDNAWKISSQIISRIPRMESVAKIIELASEPSLDGAEESAMVLKGAAALKIANGYSLLRKTGMTKAEAIADLANVEGQLESEVVIALSSVDLPEDQLVLVNLPIDKIEEGMIFGDDILTTDRLLLAPSGLKVSQPILQKLRAFRREKRLSSNLPILQPEKAQAV